MKVHLTLALALAFSVRSFGQTVYVNGSCGDDSWSGVSSVCAAPDGPKRTIQAAIPIGGTDARIVVAPGTYAENALITRDDVQQPPWTLTIESEGAPM